MDAPFSKFGNYPEIFRNRSGNFPEDFWNISGFFPEHFRNCSGMFPDMFRKFPGHFPENLRNFSGKFRTKFVSFSQFSFVFGGARQFLTSESTSLSNFAPDRPIHSSVRPLERSVGQSESRKGGLNLASASHLGVYVRGGDGHLPTNIKW